ncbi:hypothetical protein NQ839_13430, partial [Acinetobacter baumannii]|nr:hypothetical protein [Acinetobacter baumannii]
DAQESRGLGDVYKRPVEFFHQKGYIIPFCAFYSLHFPQDVGFFLCQNFIILILFNLLNYK